MFAWKVTPSVAFIFCREERDPGVRGSTGSLVLKGTLQIPRVMREGDIRITLLQKNKKATPKKRVVHNSAW